MKLIPAKFETTPTIFGGTSLTSDTETKPSHRYVLLLLLKNLSKVNINKEKKLMRLSLRRRYCLVHNQDRQLAKTQTLAGYN